MSSDWAHALTHSFSCLRYSVSLNGLCILPHCWVIFNVGKGWCRMGFLRKRYLGQAGKDCLWSRMIGVQWAVRLLRPL